jgi:hypothetical protein
MELSTETLLRMIGGMLGAVGVLLALNKIMEYLKSRRNTVYIENGRGFAYRRLIILIIIRRLTSHWITIRLFTVSLGLVAFLTGIQFLQATWPSSTFLGAFLCVTGSQITLWAIGVRSEILANVPADTNLAETEIAEDYAISVPKRKRPEGSPDA